MILTVLCQGFSASAQDIWLNKDGKTVGMTKDRYNSIVDDSEDKDSLIIGQQKIIEAKNQRIYNDSLIVASYKREKQMSDSTKAYLKNEAILANEKCSRSEKKTNLLEKISIFFGTLALALAFK